MDEVYGAPGAPVVRERGAVGSFWATLVASVAAGAVTGVAAWAAQGSPPPAVAWVGLAALAAVGAVVCAGARARGWAVAALVTAACAGLVGGMGLAVAWLPESPQLPFLESSIRAVGVQITAALWVWALVSAVALRVPRARLGAFVGAYTAKWAAVTLGFQFLVPGIAFALLGALVEVSAARRDGWRRYLRDLGGNLGPAAIAVLSAGLGAALSMAATLALYGFAGAVDGRATPLEGHVLTSLLSGVPATLGLWLAGRIASFEADS